MGGNIKIDLTTAKRWYMSGSKELISLALQAFSREELIKDLVGLPKDLDSLCSAKYKSDLDLFQKLLLMRDIYRQGWEPDWDAPEKIKYCICCKYTVLIVEPEFAYAQIFSFPTEEVAIQFLNNFRPELETLRRNLLLDSSYRFK